MAVKENFEWGLAVVGACTTFAAYMRAMGWPIVDDAPSSSARATMRVQINMCPDADKLQAALAEQPSSWRRTDGGRWRSVICMSPEADQTLHTAMHIRDVGMRTEVMRITLAHLLMGAVPADAVACAAPAITRLNGQVAVYLDCCLAPPTKTET